jgi:DNA-nicking Smr family endonuclease
MTRPPSTQPSPRPLARALARRTLSDIDRDAWAAYARHVAALPGRALPALAPEQVVPPVPQAPLPAAVKLAPVATQVSVGQQPAGLDKASWARLRTGKLLPERSLDLHGRTAQHAYIALQGFLLRAHADRVRCVEVITGRGSGETGGVIRRELPLWLNLPQLRPLVLAVTHPHAANVGAVRLLLRRTR